MDPMCLKGLQRHNCIYSTPHRTWWWWFLLIWVWLFVIPWTVDCQAPLSLGFSQQELWSGSPFPSPGDLPDPGIEPESPASPALAGRLFITDLPGKPIKSHTHLINEVAKRLTNWPMSLREEGDKRHHPRICHFVIGVVLTWGQFRPSRLRGSVYF